ncbi:ABC-type transporter ATP-binding protein EcsA [Symmachiella dynata]|uniref:ABC-type transporter ATP-binding protein EcsA n=1 Tax=Symmachiella dynata TaxID=2527995 RepID=A0A517ZX73_9PLAN|nr:ABC-type transporter ATP-binding protein EcsA [Symmachiella dynata]QDU47072.1 ABC-type transporter ATP-binding protein EcsA [Symmachiella dynata]
MQVISVRDFHKTYEKTVAVRGLSFDVEPGHILGLVGPNGAGKTTTMRAIAGILPPTHGRLLIAGNDVVETPVAAKRELAYVPDDPHLFDALSVWEHLEFIASAYEVADLETAGAALLEQFELTEKRDAFAHGLSRGMRQKLAIACAYLHNPRAILLDEPLTGLDPRGIRIMRESIKQRAAAGAAILVSSHLMSLVEGLCTHVLILSSGNQLFFGTIAEARSAYEELGGEASLEDVFFHATEGTRTQTEA